MADQETRVASPLRPDLAEELVCRCNTDQAIRETFGTGGAAALAEAVRIGDANTAWLKTVVEASGWPGWSLVGKDGSRAAWLIAQHADGDRPFQRRCLTLLNDAVGRGDAAPEDAAHLTDRVLLAGGEYQIYGTQVNASDGRYVSPRLRDPETVDARRAAVGLGTLAEHLARATERFGTPSPARVGCVTCGTPIEVWLPEPGGSRKVRCEACGFVTTIFARIGSRPGTSAES